LSQHIHTPSRCRGSDSDEPSVLDVILTHKDFINITDYLSPSGKRNHSVLLIDWNFSLSNKTFGQQFNHSKGDYANL